jgi:hypothetical protein
MTWPSLKWQIYGCTEPDRPAKVTIFIFWPGNTQAI